MTATKPSDALNDCPECGAPLVPGADKCWLCALKTERTVGAVPKELARAPDETQLAPESGPPKVQPPRFEGQTRTTPPAGADLGRTFSLSTLFLWTTLVAVVLGVARIAPGLGVLMVLLSFPAAFRTIGTVGRRKRRSGQSLPPGEKAGAFLESLAISFVTFIAIVAVIGSALFVAVYITCSDPAYKFGEAYRPSSGRSFFNWFLPIVILVAGGTITFFFIRATWRRRE
jgi:hypothetical protein